MVVYLFHELAKLMPTRSAALAAPRAAVNDPLETPLWARNRPVEWCAAMDSYGDLAFFLGHRPLVCSSSERGLEAL